MSGGQGGGGGGGSDLLGGILQGVQLNVLDAKFIGLGFVREDLVGELCTRATNQLLEEGESRAQEQVKLLKELKLSPLPDPQSYPGEQAAGPVGGVGRSALQ